MIMEAGLPMVRLPGNRLGNQCHSNVVVQIPFSSAACADEPQVHTRKYIDRLLTAFHSLSTKSRAMILRCYPKTRMFLKFKNTRLDLPPYPITL
jgi:hypothetical protein